MILCMPVIVLVATGMSAAKQAKGCTHDSPGQDAGSAATVVGSKAKSGECKCKSAYHAPFGAGSLPITLVLIQDDDRRVSRERPPCALMNVNTSLDLRMRIPVPRAPRVLGYSDLFAGAELRVRS